MGRCDTAPVCEVGHLHVDYATLESLQAVVESDRREPEFPLIRIWQSIGRQEATPSSKAAGLARAKWMPSLPNSPMEA